MANFHPNFVNSATLATNMFYTDLHLYEQRLSETSTLSFKHCRPNQGNVHQIGYDFDPWSLTLTPWIGDIEQSAWKQN